MLLCRLVLSGVAEVLNAGVAMMEGERGKRERGWKG